MWAMMQKLRVLLDMECLGKGRGIWGRSAKASMAAARACLDGGSCLRDNARPLDKTLLLFDIDGTLITTGGCGERALRLAVRDVFGVEDDLAGIEVAGRTDTSIARQLLKKHARPETEEGIRTILEAYLRHLPTLLPHAAGRILPGVRQLLDALKPRTDVVLALLTGNLVAGARHKLSQYGLWDYFEFGAFADDHHERNRLGPFALSRAAERGHAVQPDRTFIIGDTPHDIACGRAIGAKTVAVATGGFRSHQLAPHAPDVLVEDLSDMAAALTGFGLG